MVTLSKADLLAVLDGPPGRFTPLPNGLLSAEIMLALGWRVAAPKGNSGWRQWDDGDRRWVALWRPDTNIGDAIRLAEELGLAWSVQSGPGISTTACVYRPDDLGRLGDSHHGATPAAALTRAIIAEMVE